MMELYNIDDDNKRLLTVCDNPQISTWGMFDKTIIEAPVFIGRSQIDTGFVGAFTFINLRQVHDVTTNCVIECQRIGRFCMFAHAINIGFAGHPIDFISDHLVFRYDKKSLYAHDFMNLKNDLSEKRMREKYIEHSRKPLPIIENDVWVGFGATIMNGVTIGNGAVVAAGSVVTKDVEPYSVVGGNPAKVIRQRFNDKTIDALTNLCWWDYGPDIMHGIDLSDANKGIELLSERVYSGKYKKYVPPHVEIDTHKNEILVIKK